MSWIVLGLHDAMNHWRASRRRGSRRISYNCRISFTSSNVGRAMPLLIDRLIFYFFYFLAGPIFFTAAGAPPPAALAVAFAPARAQGCRSLMPSHALLFLDDADAGHRVALLQRRHGANER